MEIDENAIILLSNEFSAVEEAEKIALVYENPKVLSVNINNRPKCICKF